MAEYTETVGDDSEGRVLDALAGGMPHAFIVARNLEPLDLRVATMHSVETVRALLNQTLKALPGGAEMISDGDHTFADLYAHRRALTAALCKAASLDAWRSRKHHPDGDPMFDGYFIVGINLPTGPVTYHYQLMFWDDFDGVIELEHAPAWDGATPADSIARLLAWARPDQTAHNRHYGAPDDGPQGCLDHEVNQLSCEMCGSIRKRYYDRIAQQHKSDHGASEFAHRGHAVCDVHGDHPHDGAYCGFCPACRGAHHKSGGSEVYGWEPTEDGVRALTHTGPGVRIDPATGVPLRSHADGCCSDSTCRCEPGECACKKDDPET